MHYSDALDETVDAITRAAGRQLYDWIDGPGDHHEGLGHLDPEERDASLFTVDISISTEFMSAGEVDALDARMESVADDQGIAVDLREATDSYCVYRFSLHAKFMRVPDATRLA